MDSPDRTQYYAIGQRISDLRRELARARGVRKIPQHVIAEEVGVHSGTVTAWETGKQKPVGDNLLSLARMFGTTPEYILHGDEAEDKGEVAAASGMAAELDELIDRYVPEMLRRAFKGATDDATLRGLKVVLFDIEEIPLSERNALDADLNRRIHEARAEH